MPLRKLGNLFRRVVGIPSPKMASPTSPLDPVFPKSTTADSSLEPLTGLVLYGRSSCPYCARVDRVIKELDVEDKLVRRDTGFGSPWRADLGKRTGRTQVPCLFINGEPMFESLDIIAWMRENLT